MRAFGYRDASIFFLPFFGAAARGQKRLATARERVVEAFMGPLPGLMIGMVTLMLVARQPLWSLTPAATEALAMLIILNWINLAPFLPLDGGHIVGQLLFYRNRTLETWFHGAGIAAFASAALALDEPVFWFLVFLGAAVGAAREMTDDRARRVFLTSLLYQPLLLGLMLFDTIRL